MSDGANEMTRRLPPAWRAEKVSGGYVKLLDKLLDARLELDRPDHAHFETEVAQGGAQIVLNGDGLRLKQLAMVQ